VTSRSGRAIARAALTGANLGSTRAYALDTLQRRRCTRRKPPIGRRLMTGSGAAKDSPSRRRRSARAAPTATIGAGRKAGSIRSTAATCRWPGGPTRAFVAVTHPAPRPNLDCERSGARPMTRTFALRACRDAAQRVRLRHEQGWSELDAEASGRIDRLDLLKAVGETAVDV
jgi:hypothetical protein